MLVYANEGLKILDLNGTIMLFLASFIFVTLALFIASRVMEFMKSKKRNALIPGLLFAAIIVMVNILLYNNLGQFGETLLVSLAGWLGGIPLRMFLGTIPITMILGVFIVKYIYDLKWMESIITSVFGSLGGTLIAMVFQKVFALLGFVEMVEETLPEW